jgi:hypothetical protein
MNSHSKIDHKLRARIPPELFIQIFCLNFGSETFCFWKPLPDSKPTGTVKSTHEEPVSVSLLLSRGTDVFLPDSDLASER